MQRKPTLEERVYRLERTLKKSVKNEAKIDPVKLKYAKGLWQMLAESKSLAGWFTLDKRIKVVDWLADQIKVNFLIEDGSYTPQGEITPRERAIVKNIAKKFDREFNCSTNVTSFNDKEVRFVITDWPEKHADLDDEAPDAIWEDPEYQDMRHSADFARSQRDTNDWR